jgi:peptide-methionine (R)-S-oxide reductase
VRVKRTQLLAGATSMALGLLTACGQAPAGKPPSRAPVSPTATNRAPAVAMKEKIRKSDEEWKKELSPDQYEVLRRKGTERAFTGAYWDHHEKGVYRCAGCGEELFTSEAKFDSGCGWPSFHSPAAPSRLEAQPDQSHFMVRTEILCARCGGHLGHVFDDGPKPTGLRYCINSASLKFQKEK